MNTARGPSYFFDDGIRFQCLRCGSCCSGSPGTVYATSREAQEIAEFLRISFPQFIEKYLRPFEDGFSIREHKDGRCFFFEDECGIYSVRPAQCRTFPFWLQNMRSDRRWDDVRKACPGIGTGRMFTKSEIIERMWDRHALPGESSGPSDH
jgi:hypothetical protein